MYVRLQLTFLIATLRTYQPAPGCHRIIHTSLKYDCSMLTVVETPLFQRTWPHYWTEEERGEFCAYIAQNHEAGDVVAQSGGVRKIRWTRAGSGKSGGVRVIYFARTEAGEVVLLIMYAKSKLDALKASTLKEIRNAVEKSLQADD